MKARNNKTGEVVTNFGFSKEFGTVSYIDSKGVLTFNTPNSGEWTIIDEGESDFDWKSFRNQTAKDILCATLSGGIASGATGLMEEKGNIVKASIEISDELIKQLKEKEEK